MVTGFVVVEDVELIFWGLGGGEAAMVGIGLLRLIFVLGRTIT